MLLLHEAGTQSFEGLRTVDGQLGDTFRDAARRGGLPTNDNEWECCMTQVALFQMSRQLRRFFATLCAYSTVGDPAAIWEHHTVAPAGDLQRRFGPVGA